MKIACNLLNIIFALTSKITEKNRIRIRTGSYFVLFLIAMLYTFALPGVHLLIKCAMGVLFMAICIVFSMDKPLKPVAWNKRIVIPWVIFGIIQLISSALVSIEYVPMALVWLIGFPLMFLVWSNNGKYSSLLKEMSKALVWVYLILMIGSFLFVPITNSGYGGLPNNTNAIGQWVTVAFPMLLFLKYVDADTVVKRWLYRVLLAISYIAIFLSISRTAMFAVGAMTIFYIIFRLLYNRNTILYFIKKVILFVITIAISFVLINGVNHLVSQTHVAESVRNYTFSGIALTDKSETGNVGNTDKTYTDKTHTDVFVDRVTGNDRSDDSLENYSSGRIGIWKATIKEINLLGHPSREHIYTDRNGDVGNNVHNVLLQFAYDNGVVAGMAFLVIALIGGITCLVQSIRQRKNKNLYILCLLIHVGYLVTAMFASITLPFLYLLAFVYYMTFAIIFDDSLMIKKCK